MGRRDYFPHSDKPTRRKFPDNNSNKKSMVSKKDGIAFHFCCWGILTVSRSLIKGRLSNRCSSCKCWPSFIADFKMETPRVSLLPDVSSSSSSEGALDSSLVVAEGVNRLISEPVGDFDVVVMIGVVAPEEEDKEDEVDADMVTSVSIAWLLEVEIASCCCCC